MNINDKMRQIMRSRGITQDQIAKQLGITHSAVNQRLSANMRIDFFLQLCDIIKINPGEVLTDNENTTFANSICPYCGKPITIQIHATRTENK